MPQTLSAHESIHETLACSSSVPHTTKGHCQLEMLEKEYLLSRDSRPIAIAQVPEDLAYVLRAVLRAALGAGVGDPNPPC